LPDSAGFFKGRLYSLVFGIFSHPGKVQLVRFSVIAFSGSHAVMKKSRAKSHIFAVLLINGKYFQCLLQLLTIVSCLPALDISAALVKDFVSVLRFETDKSDAVID